MQRRPQCCALRSCRSRSLSRRQCASHPHECEQDKTTRSRAYASYLMSRRRGSSHVPMLMLLTRARYVPTATIDTCPYVRLTLPFLSSLDTRCPLPASRDHSASVAHHTSAGCCRSGSRGGGERRARGFSVHRYFGYRHNPSSWIAKSIWIAKPKWVPCHFSARERRTPDFARRSQCQNPRRLSCRRRSRWSAARSYLVYHGDSSSTSLHVAAEGACAAVLYVLVMRASVATVYLN